MVLLLLTNHVVSVHPGTQILSSRTLIRDLNVNVEQILNQVQDDTHNMVDDTHSSTQP